MVFHLRAYTHGGWAHRQQVSTTFLTRKKFFLCSWRDSNPWPLDLQSNALTTEPTRHPVIKIIGKSMHEKGTKNYQSLSIGNTLQTDSSLFFFFKKYETNNACVQLFCLCVKQVCSENVIHAWYCHTHTSLQCMQLGKCWEEEGMVINGFSRCESNSCIHRSIIQLWVYQSLPTAFHRKCPLLQIQAGMSSEKLVWNHTSQFVFCTAGLVL